MVRDGVADQFEAMESSYGAKGAAAWRVHHTQDPLTRYLRDRRLHVALDVLREHDKFRPQTQRVLVVCGGVGGEGTFLANQGFKDVTVSDLSPTALATCRDLDPRLHTRVLNAEDIEAADDEFDLTFVQDGLHHLPRPGLGLTEMLRVSRDAAVVIEPHFGLIGRLIGTEWERHDDAVNYVFRWSQQSFEQTVRSYLLAEDSPVVVRRFWDHNSQINRAVSRLPEGARLHAARALYGALRPASRAGNMFIGVAFKPDGPPPPRLVGH